MLKTILTTLAGSRRMKVDDMAGELGVSRALVEQMISNLCFRGYLREYTPDAACLGACRGCAKRASCGGSAFSFRGWTLTEKGRKAVLRSADA